MVLSGFHGQQQIRAVSQNSPGADSLLTSGRQSFTDPVHDVFFLPSRCWWIFPGLGYHGKGGQN
jgi:hypothetical protein